MRALASPFFFSPSQAHKHTSTQPHNHTTTQPHNHTTTWCIRLVRRRGTRWSRNSTRRSCSTGRTNRQCGRISSTGSSSLQTLHTRWRCVSAYFCRSWSRSQQSQSSTLQCMYAHTRAALLWLTALLSPGFAICLELPCHARPVLHRKGDACCPCRQARSRLCKGYDHEDVCACVCVRVSVSVSVSVSVCLTHQRMAFVRLWF